MSVLSSTSATQPAPVDPADLAGSPVPDGASPASPATRGRRQSPLWHIGGRLDAKLRLPLAVCGVLVVLAAWWFAALRADDPALFPTPLAAAQALGDLWSDGSLLEGLQASGNRILIGYGLSVAVAAVFGVLIGSFPSVEAFFEAQIAFLRYIPASALTPVFMLWLGLGETPKIALIFVGTVFFNILMIADVARGVPKELPNAAYTLGAGRWTVLRRVIARYSLPGIIDAARVNLAAAWMMLVVAEMLAADSGLAVGIIRAQRFRAVDTMFALLFTFGVVGLVSDLALRWFRNRVAPWARS